MWFAALVVTGLAGVVGCGESDDRQTTFFGYRPPGLAPVKFAPDILTAHRPPHSRLTVAPDGSALYWSAYTGVESQTAGYVSRFDGEKLSVPQESRFSARYSIKSLTFSPDGDRMYFSSRLPLPDRPDETVPCLWYRDRESTGWSEPVPVRTETDSVWASVGSPSVSRLGNLWFVARKEGERLPGIYHTRIPDSGFATFEKLSERVIDGGTLDPFIDPDERFLLFSAVRSEKNLGIMDMFVSFKTGDGSWSEAINLGAGISTPYMDRFPSVTPDGRFLTFVTAVGNHFPSDETDFYWVSAEILDSLRPR